jgi:anti-sigma B factor antagonist
VGAAGRQPDESVRPSGKAGDLDVSVTKDGRVTTVVHVSGDVDMLTAPVLADHVRQQLDGNGGPPRSLVIDLSGVTFLGSAGLAVLAEAHNAATERSVDLRVVASTRLVLRPLQVTGLDKLLTVVGDLGPEAGVDGDPTAR